MEEYEHVLENGCSDDARSGPYRTLFRYTQASENEDSNHSKNERSFRFDGPGSTLVFQKLGAALK
jgi:hypothetical protein